MFGNAIYIINVYDREVKGSDFEPLYPVVFENGIVDAAVNQYILGLGEFNFDAFGDNNKIVWIYFLLATVFTQLMFVNMLVGIMTATFENLTEKRQENSLMEQTKIYSDQIQLCTLNKKIRNIRYLYIVRPVSKDNDASEEQT